MNVYIPYTSYDYTQMQGPAPSGYHVPSKDEWVALYEILTSTFRMSKGAKTLGTYLKMPMAGRRNYNNASANEVGTFGRYWFSTQSDTNYASNLSFESTSIYIPGRFYRSYGLSVRCFKNSPTVPTSSWTTLYDGSSLATGAGVFWNSTDGLISVSGDGKTWYTIQDKNLGATTVYNQGDTLTDANCGYFYQWGNNYGFPHSGNVTTSSTQVNAQNYGPGNYYSSSTFITGNGDWSSVHNDNLRGGVSGVKSVSELQNAYIGEYGWKPGANTLAYYPFISDLKDYSGNGYDFTTYSGTTTFVNNMVQSTGVLRGRSLMSQLGNNFTISMYLLHAGDSCSLQDSDDMRYCTFVFGGGANGIDFNIRYNGNRYTTSYSLSPDNKIHHVVGTKENTTYKLYVDGELKSSNVYSYPIITDKAYFHLGNIGTSITKKFGNLILEKTVWTAQEVSDYYNQTKGNYGL